MSQKAAGEFPDAMETFAEATDLIDDESKSALLRFQWGDTAFKAGKFDIAKTQFLASQQAAPKADSADDALYLAAESALMLSDVNEANEILARFQQNYPDSTLKAYQTLLSVGRTNRGAAWF
jgi:TolA-binding protein